MPRPRTVDLRWNAILNDFRRSGLGGDPLARSLTICRISSLSVS
jgi:hypothetical protein